MSSDLRQKRIFATEALTHSYTARPLEEASGWFWSLLGCTASTCLRGQTGNGGQGVDLPDLAGGIMSLSMRDQSRV